MSGISGVSIRAAEPSDAPVLARLRYEFRASHDLATEPEAEFFERCTAWMTPRLMPGSSWRCWLAEAEATVIAAVWLQVIEKLPNPVEEAESHGYISSLYVVPARRAAGIGSRLLEKCLRECIDAEVDAVILWPTPRSRRLYERHGFSVRDDILERRLTPPPPHAA
jgi:GNAT superfamily N-acetyltransferase